jgi:polysaccharide biosynthesis/export protein
LLRPAGAGKFATFNCQTLSVSQYQDKAAGSMKRVYQFICVTWVLWWMCGIGSTVFAQKGMRDFGDEKQNSHPGLTEPGVRDDELMAAKPGEADARRNPLLGGERRPLYRLRPSDVAEVTFTVAPEFNQSLTVQPDGYVMLKDVGPVEAQGLTMPEFAQAIQKAYEGYLHDPEAAVVLKDFERPYFIVGGQVGKPGKYELRSDTTVAEAVQIAGGFTSEAKHSQVVLFRRVNDDLVETRLINLKKMLSQSSLKEDVHLLPGDLVFVPQNTISKIAKFMSKPSMSMYFNSSQF